VAFKYGGESTDWNGDPTATTGSAYIGLHRRAASTRMGRGWAVVDGSYIPSTGWMHLAAQRRGEYIYGVTTGTASATEDINTAFAVRCPTVDYSETRHWQVSPVFENDGEQSMTFGAVHSLWGPASNFDMHISDHDQPSIWLLQGHQVMFAQDTGIPWSYQWQSEPGPFADMSTYQPNYRYKYQMPCYFQAYYNRPYFLPPALVFPWSDGDYGPPELWWFGMENYQGAFTGRLTIYRSTWAAGNFAPSAGLEGSPHNSITRTAYNPDGYAFNHFWFDPANIVGTVGPFNIDMNHGFNPATYVPRVIRSTKNKNVLQLALMTVASTSSGWNGVHLAHSEDDGKHWSRPWQTFPGAAGDQFTTVGPPHSGTLGIAMDSTGGVWSPIYFNRKGKDSQALANWVRGTGVGNVDARNQNWKRPQGPQWL
jgi:hypothetical protein